MFGNLFNTKRLMFLGLLAATLLTARSAYAACPDCGDPGQFLGQMCPNPKCPSNGWNSRPAPATPKTGDWAGRIGLIHDATQLFPKLNQNYDKLQRELAQLQARRNELLKYWNSGQMPDSDRENVRSEYKRIETDIELAKVEIRLLNELRNRKVTIEYVNMNPSPRVRDRIHDTLKKFTGVKGDKLTIFRDQAGQVRIWLADGTDVTAKFPGVN